MPDLLEILHYEDSPGLLRADRGDFADFPDYAHVLRRAVDGCGLKGVYVLRPRGRTGNESIVPTVYVCDAASDADADKVHQRVYNQNIVPFLLVQTPHGVRLYRGFQPRDPGLPDSPPPTRQGIFEVTIALDEVGRRLQALQAEAIDDGTVWRELGGGVTPDKRVDWRLLGNLRALDAWLEKQGFDRETRHALIGRYVYLHYLKDRGILSDRKFAEWGIDKQAVFSRRATLDAFGVLAARLDVWLNGAVFPLPESGWRQLQDRHLQHIAGIFSGDEHVGGDAVQIALDFRIYDFSYIPIETLSVVYQQFLHAPADDEDASDDQDAPPRRSKGREQGAYYTPVPLVDFMLSELDDHRPLQPGMRVLDPSCGSGAFLVQCFRRLIERARKQRPSKSLSPEELRDLLVQSVYGVDSDADACRVAELSLILALLDNVDPPDLYDRREFLPTLSGANIFRDDFFDPDGGWSRFASTTEFDWVVGNPPWISIASTRVPHNLRYAWKWICDHRTSAPVGGNQVAEAFAWKTLSHLAPDGAVGLLLPAMTLFKDESKPFRQDFLRKARVWCVANFANLAYVLFSGRSQMPAAAFFYQARPEPMTDGTECHVGVEDDTSSEEIVTYSPFVVNQEANRPRHANKHRDTWSITVSRSEVRQVRTATVATGDLLPWKIAMWGSHFDERLLRRIAGRFDALGGVAKGLALKISEGFQLRSKPRNREEEQAREFRGDIVGKHTVDFGRLRQCGRIFAFPARSLAEITEDRAYLRKRGGREGLAVSYPPHIVVDASRRFAVYSDDFIAVPPRQVGIAGSADHPGHSLLLRALAAYLNSDFALYHQFFMSPEWGVDKNRANKDTLDALPVPPLDVRSRGIQQLGDLHDKLVAAVCRSAPADSIMSTHGSPVTSDTSLIVAELNGLVYDMLGVTPKEKAIVQEFVTTRIQMAKGKVSKAVVDPPPEGSMRSYLAVLQGELDAFLDDEMLLRHRVDAIYSSVSAMVCVDLVDQGEAPGEPNLWRADALEASELDSVRRRLMRQRSQWVYFDRSLKVYENTRTYMLKPMQLVLWTTGQALVDAGEIIADTLAGGEA